MLPYWALLMLVGGLLWVFSRAPACPDDWKSFVAGAGGLIFIVGLVLLVIGVLRIPLPA